MPDFLILLAFAAGNSKQTCQTNKQTNKQTNRQTEIQANKNCSTQISIYFSVVSVGLILTTYVVYRYPRISNPWIGVLFDESNCLLLIGRACSRGLIFVQWIHTAIDMWYFFPDEVMFLPLKVRENLFNLGIKHSTSVLV